MARGFHSPTAFPTIIWRAIWVLLAISAAALFPCTFPAHAQSISSLTEACKNNDKAACESLLRAPGAPIAAQRFAEYASEALRSGRTLGRRYATEWKACMGGSLGACDSVRRADFVMTEHDRGLILQTITRLGGTTDCAFGDCGRTPRPRRAHESFDELLARKAREREHAQREREKQTARAEQERQAKIERERQDRIAAEERAREARIAKANAEQQQREDQARLTAERIESAPAWVRVFRTAWPAPQGMLGGGVIAFAVIAFIGYRQFSSSPGVLFFGALIAALLCLRFTYDASATADAALAFLYAVIPAILFLLFTSPGFLRGWYYLFTKHPTEPHVSPALRTGQRINTAAAADAMEYPPEWATSPPPSYKSQHHAAEAEILKAHIQRDTSRWRQWTAAFRQRVEKDRELAQAMTERERARAEYERWQKHVAAMEKKKKQEGKWT